MKQSELLRIIKKNGARFLRDGGNHEIWISENGFKFQVPRHKKELPKGTALKIIKQSKF